MGILLVLDCMPKGLVDEALGIGTCQCECVVLALFEGFEGGHAVFEAFANAFGQGPGEL